MELDLRRRSQTKLAIRGNEDSSNHAGTAGPNTGKQVSGVRENVSPLRKRNHLQRLCRSKSSVNNSVHEINNDGDSNVYNGRESASSSEKEFFIDTVSANSSIHISPDRAFVQLHICPQKTPVNFKIDTGSSVNILPQSIYKSLNIKHPLETPSHTLTSYTGNMVPVIGMIKLASYHKSKVIQTMFYVVEGNASSLFSFQSSVA